jgi:hypothetical protein
MASERDNGTRYGDWEKEKSGSVQMCREREKERAKSREPTKLLFGVPYSVTVVVLLSLTPRYLYKLHVAM